MPSMFSRDGERRRSGDEDLVIIGIAVASLMVLAAAGNLQFEAVWRQVLLLGGANGGLLACLLLLNLALTLYGLGRYCEARREIGEHKAAQARAQSLACADPLTGFLNRASFTAAAGQLLQRKSRRAVAMLIVDIDGFKAVNEVHGHLTGDNLLRAAAEVIQGAVPHDAVRGRLGGDQFAAAFLFDSDAPAGVEASARAIAERLGRPFELGGVHVHVSASMGLARSEACTGAEALQRRAAIALHSARRLGRGRFAWFDATMAGALQMRDSVEAGLRSGIPEGRFVPYFEQQVDLVTGTLHGFEVLARWHHPERGIVSPAEFISVAEECGLIGDLSMALMRQAFEEARGWDPSLTLSVNVAPAQLKDPWLAQKIVKLLVETGFPPDRLEIDITESSLFENLGLAQSILGSLKNQGIRIALDDFGTGYSSLAHLRALPFDRIKIDRSFVTSVNDNPESAALVTVITRLAESLNLSVTAEGIEDALVEARLRAIGSYKGQGWLYGKPMPMAEARRLLADKGLLPSSRSSRQPAAGVERLRRAR